eukprot:TRINITY_DN13364_c1_g1_i1.p1 TRINITY_DN13364_c1_g1~~TRINITY_DN13364_c1_g1_i1.p1  ORF type:complete len:1065 (+),score=107.38 TRINITY_DN13364_c1_g1_i1:1183-4377(+)
MRLLSAAAENPASDPFHRRRRVIQRELGLPHEADAKQMLRALREELAHATKLWQALIDTAKALPNAFAAERDRGKAVALWSQTVRKLAKSAGSVPQCTEAEDCRVLGDSLLAAVARMRGDDACAYGSPSASPKAESEPQSGQNTPATPRGSRDDRRQSVRDQGRRKSLPRAKSAAEEPEVSKRDAHTQTGVGWGWNTAASTRRITFTNASATCVASASSSASGDVFCTGSRTFTTPGVHSVSWSIDATAEDHPQGCYVGIAYPGMTGDFDADQSSRWALLWRPDGLLFGPGSGESIGEAEPYATGDSVRMSIDIPQRLKDPGAVRLYKMGRLIKIMSVCNVKPPLTAFCHFFMAPGAKITLLPQKGDVSVDAKEVRMYSRLVQHSRSLAHTLQSQEACLMAAADSGLRPPPPTGLVTLAFTDVQSSTALWEAAPEVMRTALALHNGIFRTLIAKWRGYEVKTEGDAFMVAFTDCADALEWAVELQNTLLEAEWPTDLLSLPEPLPAACVYDPTRHLIFRGLRVRVGFHQSEPDCEVDPVTGRMDYFGPQVNLAARISGQGHGGETVIGGGTFRALQKAGALDDSDKVYVKCQGTRALKGIKKEESIFTLLPGSLRTRIGYWAQQLKAQQEPAPVRSDSVAGKEVRKKVSSSLLSRAAGAWALRAGQAWRRNASVKKASVARDTTMLRRCQAFMNVCEQLEKVLMEQNDVQSSSRADSMKRKQTQEKPVPLSPSAGSTVLRRRAGSCRETNPLHEARSAVAALAAPPQSPLLASPRKSSTIPASVPTEEQLRADVITLLDDLKRLCPTAFTPVRASAAPDASSESANGRTKPTEAPSAAPVRSEAFSNAVSPPVSPSPVRHIQVATAKGLSSPGEGPGKEEATSVRREHLQRVVPPAATDVVLGAPTVVRCDDVQLNVAAAPSPAGRPVQGLVPKTKPAGAAPPPQPQPQQQHQRPASAGPSDEQALRLVLGYRRLVPAASLQPAVVSMSERSGVDIFFETSNRSPQVNHSSLYVGERPDRPASAQSRQVGGKRRGGGRGTAGFAGTGCVVSPGRLRVTRHPSPG